MYDFTSLLEFLTKLLCITHYHARKKQAIRDVNSSEDTGAMILLCAYVNFEWILSSCLGKMQHEFVHQFF